MTGIHLAQDGVHALALRGARKNLTVAGGAVVPHAAQGDDAGPALRAAVRAAKLKMADAMLALPKMQAIVRNVTLPSTDAAELVQMARFETERHIPFHAERHCTGHHVMRTMGVEGSEVLLAAVDGPIVERALEATQAANLRPRGVTLTSVALTNALILDRREWMSGKTVALIGAGLAELDIVLIHDGRILFARAVALDLRTALEAQLGRQAGAEATPPDRPRLAHAARMADCMKLRVAEGEAGVAAGESNPQLEAWLARLTQELRKTYDFARREMKCPPIDAVVLTGEGAAVKNIDEYFRSQTDSEIALLNPVIELPGAREQKFPFEGLEFVIALGAAVAGDLPGAYKIDLTSPEYYRSQSRGRARRQLVVSAGLICLAIGLGVAGWLRFSSIRARQYEAYQVLIDEMRPRVGELQEMEKKLAIIHNYMNDPNNAMAVLSSISKSPVIPGQVTLSRVQYDMGRQVSLTGHAKTPTDLDAFLRDLVNSNHFEQPIDRQQNPANVYGFPVYSFDLTGELNERGAGSRERS